MSSLFIPFVNDSSVEVKEGGATMQTIVVSLIVIKSFFRPGSGVLGLFIGPLKSLKLFLIIESSF